MSKTLIKLADQVEKEIESIQSGRKVHNEPDDESGNTISVTVSSSSIIKINLNPY